MIGAEHLRQRLELVRREHHAVDVDALQIVRWGMRQVGMAVGPRSPGMIDAARISTEVTATMSSQDLQPGMALEHSVEDQIVQRQRGIERIADHVVEIEAGEAPA